MAAVTDADCKMAFAAAQDALTGTGRDADYILRHVGPTDDGLRCVAGFYDRDTNQRSEVIVEWTPDARALRERFTLGLLKP